MVATTSQMEMMNSKMNRSFSELFKNPILPQFGKEKRSSTRVGQESKRQKEVVEERLASRLSTPVGQKRSSRKSTIRPTKKNDNTTDLGTHSGHDTVGHDTVTTGGTSSSWDSLSTVEQEATDIVEQEDIDIANKMNQSKVENDEIQQKVQGRAKHGTAPGSPSSKDRRAAKSESDHTKSRSRRAKPEGQDALLEEVIEIKTSSNHHDKRKSTRRGAKSTTRRTSGKGTTSTNRREKSDLCASKGDQSYSSPSSKSRRHTTIDSSSRRRYSSRRATVLAAAAHNESPAASVPPPARREDTWTCKCGFVMQGSYSFCGMCGCKKHWTCKQCHFKDNMSCFAFCGNCGVSRASAESDNEEGSLEDPFLNLTTSPPKLLTMYD